MAIEEEEAEAVSKKAAERKEEGLPCDHYATAGGDAGGAFEPSPTNHVVGEKGNPYDLSEAKSTEKVPKDEDAWWEEEDKEYLDDLMDIDDLLGEDLMADDPQEPETQIRRT